MTYPLTNDNQTHEQAIPEVLAQAQRRYDELLRSADEVMRVMQMVDSIAYAGGDDEVGFIGVDRAGEGVE